MTATPSGNRRYTDEELEALIQCVNLRATLNRLDRIQQMMDELAEEVAHALR